MKDYNTTWENLHENNYFKNHHMYNKFEVMKPHNVNSTEIEGKIVLDIGAGYGRHMAWFCNYTNHVYGVDVSNKILNEAKQFLTSKNFKNFSIYLNTDYQKYITLVDYVF